VPRSKKKKKKKNIERLIVLPSQSVELSLSGNQFFAELFEKFDKDKDRSLSEQELENLFQTAPENPFRNLPATTVTNKLNHLTLKGFLAMWG